MAYTDEQKRQHILELQAYLHGISHQSQLPHLIPDGVYGENTANAVRLFQQQNQLPRRRRPQKKQPWRMQRSRRRRSGQQPRRRAQRQPGTNDEKFYA